MEGLRQFDAILKEASVLTFFAWITVDLAIAAVFVHRVSEESFTDFATLVAEVLGGSMEADA